MSSDLRRASASGTATEDFLVQGMTCGSCANRVQRALRKQLGVQDAMVNFATGKTHVVFDPATTDSVALAAAVDTAGYVLTRLVSPEQEQEQARAEAAEAAAANGWKGGEVLERGKRIDTVVFEKTGTLTTGQTTLTEIVVSPTTSRIEVLRRASSVEAGSEHPLAQAVSQGARHQHVALADPTDFKSVAGHGVQGTVDGVLVHVGRRTLMNETGLVLTAELERAAVAMEEAGRTAIFTGWNGHVQGVLGVSDVLKPDAAAAVSDLQSMGISVVMITGDNARTAHAIAAQVGIDRVLAEVLPEDKVAEVRRLQAQGHRVAMVGDGVNDSPALVQADLGVAIGTNTDVAIEAFEITLLSDRLDGVATSIRLSRRTFRTILQNLGWAFGYNLAALPLAALGLLNPVIGAAAMGISNVSVVSNSVRLFRFKT